MAWYSSGATNKELIDNLCGNGLISTDVIASAFRCVDRIHFVPEGCRDLAYSDRPLKVGNVHISAPHIYCTVVDNIELAANSSQSFLNIGVGTGYLSCIVARILGPRSQSFGVEIHDDVIQHCLRSMEKWKESLDFGISVPTIVHGNGLEIMDEGESQFGFDRIYVGAAITSRDLQKIQQLLAPGGILIAPVEDRLTKVKRLDEFIEERIAGVHFAPLVTSPKQSVIIPTMKWCPDLHFLYPDSFQKAAMTLLLCSRSSHVQPPKKINERLNFSSILPKEIWVHVLSFTNKKWFEPETNEVERIKARLDREKSKIEKVEHEKHILQRENAMLAHEKKLCLSLIHRMKIELHRVLDQQAGIRGEVMEDLLSRTTVELLNEADNVFNMYRNSSIEMDVDNSPADLSEQYDMDFETFSSDHESEPDEWESNVDYSEQDAYLPNYSLRAQHRTISISHDDDI